MPRFLNEIKENEMEVPHSSNGTIKNEVYLTREAYNELVENDNLEPNTIYHIEGYETGTMSTKDVINIAHPYGTIFETYNENFNPNTTWEGTKWEYIKGEHKRENVGSIDLISGSISGTAPVNETNILGAYGFDLVQGLFFGTRLDNGSTLDDGKFHKEYKLVCQGTTSGNGQVYAALNDEWTLHEVQTWSGSTYRELSSTDYIDARYLTLEPTMGYTSQNGINLKYKVTGTGSFEIFHMSINGYITENAITYYWKRVLDDHVFTQDECKARVYTYNSFTYCSDEGSDSTGYIFSIRNRQTTVAYAFYHVNKNDLTVEDVT